MHLKSFLTCTVVNYIVPILSLPITHQVVGSMFCYSKFDSANCDMCLMPLAVWAELDQSLDPWSQSSFPTWVAGWQLLEPPPAASWGAHQQEAGIRSRAETWSSVLSHRRQIFTRVSSDRSSAHLYHWFWHHKKEYKIICSVFPRIMVTRDECS